MKILMINVVCGIKSTGRICSDLAEELDRLGHEVKIAYGRDPVPEKYQKYAVRIGNDVDVAFHAGVSRLTDSAGFHSALCTKRFIKWIEEYDPDVINIHNIHGYYIHVGILFSYLRKSGKKIIWTMHDVWPITGHSALCDGDHCEKWKEGCGQCPQRMVYPKSYIDRSKWNWKKKKQCFTGISKLTIVTPSHWLAQNVKQSILGEYPVEVIHNGINTEVFHRVDGSGFRKKYHLEDVFIVLGVATSWGYKKGYGDYIKLSEMLGNKYKVVLVGVEEKLRTDKYPNLLTLGLTNGVQKLVEIYSTADVFVNLTYCDTFPTVNLEARACGLPIITYNTGGSPEAAGEDAMVVAKGDLDRVKYEINKIYANDTAVLAEKVDLIDKNYAIRKYMEQILIV